MVAEIENLAVNRRGMAVQDPKVGRHFDYDSVNLYYMSKIKSFPTATPDLVLPKQIFKSVDVLCAHLRDVAIEHDIPINTCTTWSEYMASLPSDKQAYVWKYREYVFACAMLFIGSFFSVKHEDVSFLEGIHRKVPSDFDIKNHSFTIVGSSKLTSDIDITIEGPRASILISIIEDLFIYMTEKEQIPIRCWDVEFYGDFHILQSMFVNMSKFKSLARIPLLKFALMSYFRSTGQGAASSPSISPSVEFLVRKCLALINDSKQVYAVFVQNAYNAWQTEAPGGVLNRAEFYKQLGAIEEDSILISAFLKHLEGATATESNNVALEETSGIAAEMIAYRTFNALMIANLHRAESYVLPSTAIHVVEMEQKRIGRGEGGLPESWFANNARIGIDEFGYLLSAIEQLGYLEHYHPSNVACDKKGIKYFGRYVRALLNAGLLTAESPFIPVSQELNAYRSSDDPSVVCKHNVHVQLRNILQSLSGMKGGGKKRRHTRRLRRKIRFSRVRKN